MDRIALSPLTATVLLIVFAVALGAVVLTWGESFVTEDIEIAGTCPTGCIPADLGGVTGGAVLYAEESDVVPGFGNGA